MKRRRSHARRRHRAGCFLLATVIAVGVLILILVWRL
jgi:hypothetical protein